MKKWSIGKFYLQWGHPEFDMEKAIGKYLMQLDRCTAKVVVVSPQYGDKHYRCEVIADAVGLLEWAEPHSKAVWSSDKEEQAARLALPFWLRGADLSSDSPTYVPHFFYVVLELYMMDFVNRGITEIICPECNQVADNIVMNKLNERHEINWHWWTDEWYCEKGHLLYMEDHELKFFCK